MDDLRRTCAQPVNSSVPDIQLQRVFNDTQWVSSRDPPTHSHVVSSQWSKRHRRQKKINNALPRRSIVVSSDPPPQPSPSPHRSHCFCVSGHLKVVVCIFCELVQGDVRRSDVSACRSHLCLS